MTPLTQQLEDKKKELESLEHPDCMGNWEENQGQKHEICQAEIAILEQAIAEMQKQRQEILDEIRQRKKVYQTETTECEGTWDAWFELRQIELFIEQLNQPKTEQ